MKIIRNICICILVLMIFGKVSGQNNRLKKGPLEGTWVEQENKSDTIVFSSEYEGQNPVFLLKRGYRISDGYKLPDYYSGYYWYRIAQDSISLDWFFSSGSFQSYFFKMLPEKKKFMIGNFFKNPENSMKEKDTLVFIRTE